MRKKLKSIVMIFASILLCGSNMLSTVMIKANVTKLEDTGYWHSGQAHNPDNPAQTAWFDHQKIEKIHVEQGVGVCSEPWEVIGDWGGYVTSPIQEGRIADIWNYAYVNTNQSKWNYAVGQLMVWEYLGYKPTAHNVPNYEKRKAEVNASIANMSKKPSFSGKKIILNIGESKTLTDTNGVLSDFKGKESVPKGISVKRNGNKLTVTASTTAAENSTYSLNKIRPEMIGQSIVHRKPGGQDILVPLRADPGTFKLKIQVNKYGALKITKQDEDGNLVPNTSFKVSKNADMSSPIGTYKTGSDGTVTVNDLAPATYYVQESAVPNHLILDKTIHTVSVSANKTASFTARNKWKKGRVQIRKVDTDSKKQVAGATYAIFNQQGQELQRLVTKASGYSMSGYLRVGAYYVQEAFSFCCRIESTPVRSGSSRYRPSKILVTSSLLCIRPFAVAAHSYATSSKIPYS
ncbi:MSCRAMM family protein [[Clostridium] innocuum]|uniref:MSCRAMM family protein n=1 Tax=Clostridium innocuum TaxID=1522 RepID=UPI001FD9F3A2|nr:prealbumin-like fold domain-containing protein [[Clostridium] innocuum]